MSRMGLRFLSSHLSSRFISTHTPDVDLGSDQTCCRVPPSPRWGPDLHCQEPSCPAKWIRLGFSATRLIKNNRVGEEMARRGRGLKSQPRNMKDKTLACRLQGTTTNTGPRVKPDLPRREGGGPTSAFNQLHICTKSTEGLRRQNDDFH